MELSASSLSTARLRLDPLVAADADAMVAVLGDERMYQFTGGRPPSVQQLRDRYERLAVGRSADGNERWLNWILRQRDDECPVGVIQATVTDDGRSAAVAWEVGVAWQGRGIASEAAMEVVDWLIGEGVGTITAAIHPQHRASKRVAERAGLTPTDELDDGEVVWRRVSTRAANR